MTTPRISIQSEDFDIATETSRVQGKAGTTGAVVSFTGLCRDEGGRLEALELEHYPGMAKAEIFEIASSAIDQFQLSGLTVIHRFGKLQPGENIVLVLAAASHRKQAFQGAEFVMDFLKTRAPFWKKEHGIDGTAGSWVDAREVDDQAVDRWKK